MQLQVAVMLEISFLAGEIFCEEALSANLALFRSKPNVDGSSKKEPDTGPGKATDGRIDATDLLMHFVTDDTSVDPDPYWFVRLDDMYLVQTVEVFPRIDCCYDTTGTIKVLVGESTNDNGGITNPQCGEPQNMNSVPKHVFRCELYGKVVTVKKDNAKAANRLALLEVMVNKEPSPNIALGRPTSFSSRHSTSAGSSNVVDGVLSSARFVSKAGVLPHWLNIDFESSKYVHKIIVIPRTRYFKGLEEIILTVGDDAADNGKHNAKIGDVHDFSKKDQSIVYVLPRLKGRYFYFESLRTKANINLFEIQIHSESMPFIMLRTYEPRLRSQTVYQGNTAVLVCTTMGYPRPYIAWLKDGVVIKNTTADQRLKWTVNDTIGSNHTYACHVTNIHGKDYYPIEVTVAGRYDMCMKPEEIRDPTRSVQYKQKPSVPAKSDATMFDGSKMHSVFNSATFLNMKMATSCPPPSSCGTNAPGWLSGSHPTPEKGIVRGQVCFHYNGDCCFKSAYISIINCPGMFLYTFESTAKFNFPARYCFEDDTNNQGYLQFQFVSTLFAPVGGSDTALINHVIAKEHGIEGTTQCLIVCMMNRCRSLNYDKTEKICEVSDVTKDDYPRDLSAKAGFQYYHPMKQPVVVKKFN